MHLWDHRVSGEQENFGGVYQKPLFDWFGVVVPKKIAITS